MGDNNGVVKEALLEAAKNKVTGFGLDEGVEMGPLITPESKARVEQLIEKGMAEGATDAGPFHGLVSDDIVEVVDVVREQIITGAFTVPYFNEIPTIYFESAYVYGRV